MNFPKIEERVAAYLSHFNTHVLEIPYGLSIVTLSQISCKSDKTIKSAVIYINRNNNDTHTFFTYVGDLSGSASQMLQMSPEEILIITVLSRFTKDAEYIRNQIANYIHSM